MKLFSILTALLVAAGLYFFVFQRDEVVEFAGAAPDPAPQDVAIPEKDSIRAVSVVALSSRARQIDSAVRLRGQTEADRQVEVRAETDGRIVSSPLAEGHLRRSGTIVVPA